MPIDEQKFQEYIQQREESKKQELLKYDELKDVIILFGKYI